MFEMGDEISVYDDSPWDNGTAFDLKRGATFTVRGTWKKGGYVGRGVVADVDCVSIGVQRDVDAPPGTLFTSDLWPAFRFRKVERRRDRKALYQKLGISRMLDPCPEVV